MPSLVILAASILRCRAEKQTNKHTNKHTNTAENPTLAIVGAFLRIDVTLPVL